ncbi:hypothetical protein KEJ25_07335, partial [Candidatus Bathyarchaeota archaeon]|nr:hypothetical protein [Candidatus Bathyarchaeota archaeon]
MALREILVPTIAALTVKKLKATAASVLNSLGAIQSIVTPFAPIVLVLFTSPSKSFTIPLLLTFIAITFMIPLRRFVEIKPNPNIKALKAMFMDRKLLILTSLLALDTPVWLMLVSYTLLIAVRNGEFDIIYVALHNS